MEHLRIMGLIEPVVNSSPNKVALIGHNGEIVTYKQLGESVKAVSHYLAAHGIKPNQRIAFVSSSGLETAIAFLAVSDTASFVPLNPDYFEQQYRYYFDILKIDALLIPEDYQGSLLEIAQQYKMDVFYLKTGGGDKDIKYEIIGGEKRTVPTRVLAKGHDIAMVNYTSGTTSQPKIVPRSHINVCFGVQKRINDFSLTSSDRSMNITPMFRSVGLNSVLAALCSGGSAICADRFELNHFFHFLNETSPTYFAASPVVFQTIVEHAEKYNLQFKDSSLRFVRSTGARLTEALTDRINKVFNVPVYVSYGLTETGGIANTSSAPQGYKAGSVGVPVQVEIVIMDENSRTLEANVEGEIIVRGPQVIKRYDNDEQTNRVSFYGEWFRTGDAGYLDEDGYLFITGRFKEIINRGGEKISPYEVEESIFNHPNVEQAVVFPVPVVDGNEDVGAAVVLKSGTGLYLKELRRFLHGRVAAFKMPTILYVLSDIPVGEGGKVQRKKLHTTILSLGIQPQPEAGENEEIILPRNETEKTLLKIFTRILPVKRISVTDSFFELGGDSLRAAILYDQIVKGFHLQIPIKIIFQNGSIEELADYIVENNEQGITHSFVVPFQKGGSKTPLFFIHAAEGEAVIYHHIARGFDPDRPFYGINFNHKAVKWIHPLTFEQAARHYINEIRSIQPEGPYNLAGQCVGGILAYEMACQLKEAQQEITLLAMYDSIIPGTEKGSTLINKLKSNLDDIRKYGVVKYIAIKKYYYRIRLQSALYKETPNALKPLIFYFIGKDSWIKYARSVYQLKPYPGEIIYFNPDEDSGKSSNESINRWTELVSSIKVIPLTGKHDSVFFAENADNTRRALEEQLHDLH